MNIVFSPTGLTIRGPTQAEDFSYSVIETPVVSSTPAIKKDAAIIIDINNNDFKLAVTDSTLLPGHEFVNQSPTVVSVDATGNVAMLSNAPGTVVVNIKTPVGMRQYSRAMVDKGVTAVQSFQPGTLGKHITDNLLALVSGKTASDANMALFSSATYSITAPAAVRNPSCFTAALDLSGISFTNASGQTSSPQYAFPYHAISPRHVICAHHIVPGSALPHTVVFMRADGTFQTANVVSWHQIGTTDIAIGYLSTPLTGVYLFRLLPANWASYLPALTGAVLAKLPALSKGIFTLGLMGYENQININYFQGVTSAGLNCPTALPSTPAMATDPWYIPVSQGDSSGAVFVIINGQLVLLTSYYTAYGGPAYMNHQADIAGAMNTLAAAQGDGTTYAPLYADLSSFTAY